MKRKIIIAALLISSVAAFAQQAPKMPERVTVVYTAKEAIKTDSLLRIVSAKLLSTSLPSNQVQDILKDLSESSRNFYGFLQQQIIVANSPTESDKDKKAKPKQ